MTSLADFLLARIAEDERSAQEAAATAPGHWASWNHRAHALDLRDLASPEAGRIAEVPFGADEHIARHDPARVLAECAARRRIVDFYRAVPEGMQQPYRAGLGRALRCLALPYAEHPDYLQEWRP